MTKVKLLSALAIVAIVITLQSCSKIAQLLQYSIPQSGSVTIKIPPSADTSGTISGTATNYINIDSVIKANTANTLGVSNITSVKLTSATLTLLNAGTANNFQNFESCSGSFYTNAVTTPYTVSIADNPNVYETTLALPVDSTVELKSYLTGNQFTYSAGGHLRAATTDTLTCTVTFTFDIHVQG